MYVYGAWVPACCGVRLGEAQHPEPQHSSTQAT
jgi:hypothetical protein